MIYNVLKIDEWLKFQESDDLDFLAHVSILKEERIGLSVADLYNLAKEYGFDIEKKTTIDMCWNIYNTQFNYE